MNFITKNIKSITTKDNTVYFELNLNKNISFESNQIKKLYIKKQPVNVFYFIGIGIALLILLFFYLNLSVKMSFIAIVIYCILYLFIKKMQYSLLLIGNDDEKHVFYFNKNLKFEVIEQIKIIRGNIQEVLFHHNLKNF